MKHPLASLLLISSLAIAPPAMAQGKIVHITGAVPAPRTVNAEEPGLTIHTAVAKAGLDLTPFYSYKPANENPTPCPIEVVHHRNGPPEKFDPTRNEAQLRNTVPQAGDTIEIIDYQRYPEIIKTRESRVLRMLELGSTEIGDEIRTLAQLRHAYATWSGQHHDPDLIDSKMYLEKEAIRLIDEGHGPKIIGLIELRHGDFILSGLGQAHPQLRLTEEILTIFMVLHGPVDD